MNPEPHYSEARGLLHLGTGSRRLQEAASARFTTNKESALTSTAPITIAFAGPGLSTPANTADLLNDWLGFGEPDEDGFYAPSDREVTLILPITTESLESEGLQNVLDWSEKAELPFIAVTDGSKGRKVTRLLDEADSTHQVTNVESKIISLLKDVEGEAVLVALWGDEGDEFTERLLSLADEAGIPAKDLTAGLDDLTFGPDDAAAPAAEPEPEPTPEPEPDPEAAPRRRRGRAAAPASDEAVEEEKPLTEEDVKPEVIPDVAAVRKRGSDTLKASAAAAAESLRAANSGTTNVSLAGKAAPISTVVTAFPTPADLEHRFTAHAPSPEKAELHVSVRDACLTLAKHVHATVPDGREKATALTKIEEVMFWANAGLARQNTAPIESVAAAPEKPVEAEQEAPKRGRGRPRKDGTPAQPRTEDDLKVSYLEDEEGLLRKRGRGRPRKGEKVVELSPAEVEAATADGRIEQDEE
jgi:hypothetical protein